MFSTYLLDLETECKFVCSNTELSNSLLIQGPMKFILFFPKFCVFHFILEGFCVS